MTELDADVTRPGARRAERSSRWPRLGGQGGSRVRDLSTRRRTHGLPGTLGMTVLSAFVPGAGLLYAGRRVLGVIVLAAWLAIIGGIVWYFASGEADFGSNSTVKSTKFDGVIDRAAQLAFHTTALRWVEAGIAVLLLVWAFLLYSSYRLVRPRLRPRWHTVVGNALVLALVVAIGAPFVRAIQYADATATGIEQVFPENPLSPTAPQNVTTADPWAGQSRVNVLLLGGDGGVGRTGVRTDSMILASIDTASGKTTLFSLPRNMMYAQFPKDSPLHQIYPDGYGKGGTLDPSFYELNAIYGQVPLNYPHILGKSDNEGADAIKEAVSGTLGIPVNYYMLVELKGFQQVVDAMGGITVNVNEPVAINGNTDLNIPPTGYVEPGPNEHLDGFHALWFARGRYGADDYQRMDRQRCAINSLIHAADPPTLLANYLSLVKAGEDVVYTDIPRRLGPAFVDLLLKVKQASVRSVLFTRSDKFVSEDPDFTYIHSVVQNALNPPPKKDGKGHQHEAEVQKPSEVCGYHPAPGVTMSDGSPVPAP